MPELRISVRRVRSTLPVLGMLALSLTPFGQAWCQRPPSRVSLGFGVDTTLADVGSIVRTVVEYFRLPKPGRTPTALWNQAEQKLRPNYDITARMVFQGAPATIVAVVPTGEDHREYVVKTLFAGADSNGTNIRPLAIQRLYATRVGDRWELSSALPRLTWDWSTREAGPIVYHIPPGWQFNDGNAHRAVNFVDSLARSLEIDPPHRIDYYLARSTEDMYRILGLDFYVEPSGPGTGRGGRAFVHAGIVLSGNPALGEAYLHELVHVVTGRGRPDSLTNDLVQEGLAVWLAGSRGRSYAEVVRQLLEYQRARPGVGLEDLVRGRVPGGWGNSEADALYATAALIVDATYSSLEGEGLQRLLATGPPNHAVLGALRDLLEIPESGLDQWWRSEVKRALDRRQ